MQVKLFVGNLAWSVDDETLATVFQEHGNVQQARVIHDRESGRSRGFGFVEIEVESLDTVIQSTDGLEVNGRPIRVNEAQDKGGSRGLRRNAVGSSDRGGFARH